MGERQNRTFHFTFNTSLKVGFQGSRITSDAGLLLVRELDEQLGLGQLISNNLKDERSGRNTQLPVSDLLRQSIYSRLAGYEDLNDAERLSQDPTFRLIGSEKIRDRGAALPSRLHWFETKVLSQAANLSGLAAMNREMIARAEGQDRSSRAILDMDSTEIPVYGEQEQSAYNTHYASTCYHPLLLFNAGADCVAVKLRPGNVHSADDCKQLLMPEIERLKKLDKDVWFRADAAFESSQQSAVLWLPQLVPGQQASLAKILSSLEPKPHDICPILPFPSHDLRQPEKLITEFRTELESTWDVDPRNVVFASEGNPLDLYRSILRIDDERGEVFKETGGSILVLSPIGSKLLSLGVCRA
jgi:hypothetical protein